MNFWCKSYLVIALSCGRGLASLQDGETSLKTKVAPAMTKGLNSLDSISNFRGFVECENPNPKLDSFLGRITKMEAPSKKVGMGPMGILTPSLEAFTHVSYDFRYLKLSPARRAPSATRTSCCPGPCSKTQARPSASASTAAPRRSCPSTRRSRGSSSPPSRSL